MLRECWLDKTKQYYFHKQDFVDYIAGYVEEKRGISNATINDLTYFEKETINWQHFWKYQDVKKHLDDCPQLLESYCEITEDNIETLRYVLDPQFLLKYIYKHKREKTVSRNLWDMEGLYKAYSTAKTDGAITKDGDSYLLGNGSSYGIIIPRSDTSGWGYQWLDELLKRIKPNTPYSSAQVVTNYQSSSSGQFDVNNGSTKITDLFKYGNQSRNKITNFSLTKDQLNQIARLSLYTSNKTSPIRVSQMQLVEGTYTVNTFPEYHDYEDPADIVETNVFSKLWYNYVTKIGDTYFVDPHLFCKEVEFSPIQTYIPEKDRDYVLDKIHNKSIQLEDYNGISEEATFKIDFSKVMGDVKPPDLNKISEEYKYVAYDFNGTKQRLFSSFMPTFDFDFFRTYYADIIVGLYNKSIEELKQLIQGWNFTYEDMTLLTNKAGVTTQFTDTISLLQSYFDDHNKNLVEL